jgi:hypothetical protein
MEERPSNSSHFQPGRGKTGGRQPGVHNRTTRLLKEALILAAELEGRDGRGKGELVGFLRRVANEDIRTFAMLLGRVIPLQVDTKNDTRVEVAYDTIDDVRRDLEAQGINLDMLKKALHLPVEEFDDHNVVKLPRGSTTN